MTEKNKSTWNGFSLKPRKEMPDGLWMRCLACEHMLYKSTVEDNQNVCPECNYHFRVEAEIRIKYLADEGSFQEFLPDMTTGDPLNFKFRGTTYKKRLKEDEEKSGSTEAMRIGMAFIKGRPVVLGVMEPNFLMGSMGAVVGEKFCAAVDEAMKKELALVVVCCSGGARLKLQVEVQGESLVYQSDRHPSRYGAGLCTGVGFLVYSKHHPSRELSSNDSDAMAGGICVRRCRTCPHGLDHAVVYLGRRWWDTGPMAAGQELHCSRSLSLRPKSDAHRG